MNCHSLKNAGVHNFTGLDKVIVRVLIWSVPSSIILLLFISTSYSTRINNTQYNTTIYLSLTLVFCSSSRKQKHLQRRLSNPLGWAAVNHPSISRQAVWLNRQVLRTGRSWCGRCSSSSDFFCVFCVCVFMMPALLSSRTHYYYYYYSIRGWHSERVFVNGASISSLKYFSLWDNRALTLVSRDIGRGCMDWHTLLYEV